MNKDALKIVLKGLEHYMPYAETSEVVILAELITYFKEVIKADD
jgi:hypothetical protein